MPTSTHQHLHGAFDADCGFGSDGWRLAALTVWGHCEIKWLGLGRTRPGAARSRKTPDPPAGAAQQKRDRKPRDQISDLVARKPKGGTWVRPPLLAATVPRSGARQGTPSSIRITPHYPHSSAAIASTCNFCRKRSSAA
jgi:hypothetical protein